MNIKPTKKRIKHECRETAENDYIRSTISISGIAIKYQVPIGTVRNWNKRYSWAAKRKKLALPSKLLKNKELKTIEMFDDLGMPKNQVIQLCIDGMKDSKGNVRLSYLQEYNKMVGGYAPTREQVEILDSAQAVEDAWEERQRINADKATDGHIEAIEDTDTATNTNTNTNTLEDTINRALESDKSNDDSDIDQSASKQDDDNKQ